MLLGTKLWTITEQSITCDGPFNTKQWNFLVLAYVLAFPKINKEI